jgi:DNA segregation ATPase FtsK/SpoIIIE, S-DNA-T family
MAQNTIKPQQPKKERKTTANNDGQQLSLSFDKWFKDNRSLLYWGGGVIVLSICLLLAFVSYLFNGAADQSVVGSAFKTKLQLNEAKNFIGLVGAVVAHFFIFKWFGIAAIVLPFLMFLIGFRIATGRELLPLKRTLQIAIFYMVFSSLLFGFFVIAADAVQHYSFLCGGFGYEVVSFLYHYLRWGSLFVILGVLVAFLIFFHGISSINEFLDLFERQRPLRSIPLEVVDEDEMDEEDQEEDEPKPVKIKSPKLDLIVEQPDEDGRIVLDNRPKEKDPSAKGGLTLVIENANDFADDEPTEHTHVPAPTSETIAPIIPFANQPDKSDILAEFGPYDPTLELSSYKYPTLDLLHDRNDSGSRVTADELEANKDKIVETLGNYGIGIASIKATIGPTVTLYEIIPEAGVRISKIKNLEDDIALSLAALGIRIIAPMPGKGTIGIEVPNKNREMVSIRSVLASKKFQESTADLPVVLGKTISNELFVTDLSKMPHLLMAGATGQGKSVGLNVLLASLIYKKHPATLKFVLVDPKKVELTLFNKIERHFLAKLPNTDEPIITDTKKVVYTLNSLCIEMDNRYDLLKNAGVRNIKEYNSKFIQRQLNPEHGHRYLPYIVLVIDELADLMMTAGKEVEVPIARLAQLARAIGIHLVVATQRPSVNVITGLIKANFPARLSFRVTSKIDSRTILDTGGSEQLVGMGDMLLSMGSDMIRLQCPFVDTDEIDEICDFIGNQRGYPSAYYLPEFSGDDDSGDREEVDMKSLDPMFDDAARLIVASQQGSTSLIQRKMKLGYNRAGRIMDQLEAAGIVGPFEGSKAREVMILDMVAIEEHLKRIRGL